MPETQLTIVVSGDVTVDWNLARDQLVPDDDHVDVAAGGRAWRRGGAALLADILELAAATAGPRTAITVVRPRDGDRQTILPGDERFHHSYAVWSRVARDADGKEATTAWRADSLLGVDRARDDAVARTEWRHLTSVLRDADVVVLDDAALGFRELSELDVWRKTFDTRRPWIVLKQARPVAEGPLWEHLLATAADRLVLVLSIDDLRGREVQVTRALSWERTAQDLLWELSHKPNVNALALPAHTIVSFGAAGAALLSRQDGSAAPTCGLYFDPDLVEGMWESVHPGRVMGTSDCLTAAIAREIARHHRAPDLGRGIQAGVVAVRRLHLDGYRETGTGRLALSFPVAAVVEEMQAHREPLHFVEVPDPATSHRYWTILQDRCTGDLAAKAAEIATQGAERALHGIPLGRFGKLVTADRSEIEAFRSVAALIAEYVDNPATQPLSIGVFGPPGAGKSFGVKQVARAVARGKVDPEPLEFNLAQLAAHGELADAFHLVRDRALAGRIPLVFWDEFDTALGSEAFGWLRHFLAPMQDGTFREGQITHPIGRAIFVFAGGTSARMQDFAERMHSDEGRQAKGPDFVSRLKGFVNVLGPNPQEGHDPHHVIRRAILLRSILERATPQLFANGALRIDPGVLRAFLETRTYRHGARSLEAIIAMSRLSRASTYERSSLPPEPQLDLHVDARDFLAHVQQPDLEGDLLDRLARATHERFCESLEAEGWTHGPEADADHLVSDSLIPYDDLDDYKREQNRRSVSDIPTKLARAGCVMVPARADLPAFAFSDAEIEDLARLEHERYLRDLGPGWRYGSPTDKARRISEAYLPWEELSEDERDKDRAAVRAIPDILERAGYAAVRTGERASATPA